MTLQRCSRAAAIVLLLVCSASGRASAQCAGDCDGDETVTIAEIVYAARITLASASAASCTAADLNHDHAIAVSELVVGVDMALHGCPIAVATPTPHPTATQPLGPTESPDSPRYDAFAAIAGRLCPVIRSFGARQSRFSFGCQNGRGHDFRVAIEIFADHASALAVFETRAAMGSPTTFEEFPASTWQRQERFVLRRYLTWLADCAVVEAESADESIYGRAPNPLELSGAVVDFVRQHILPGCNASRAS